MSYGKYIVSDRLVNSNSQNRDSGVDIDLGPLPSPVCNSKQNPDSSLGNNTSGQQAATSTRAALTVN